MISLVVVLLLGGGAVVAGGLYLRSVESGIDRVDAFEDVPVESRPEPVVEGAMNVMILGSDSRDPEKTSGSRTDTIILAHLPKDRSSAQLISIPRDTWVSVPRSKDGNHGGRDAKINAAYAWGGVPLMVQTVEKFTNVRVDHVAIIDFAGFKEIIDALGGIEVDVEKNFTSIHPPFRNFRKGMQEMDGETALDYSRQRKQFADGDFARIRHQQQVIKAILDKAASGGLLTNPGKLNSFLQATSNSVSIDKNMSLLDMANQMHGVRGNNLTFVTSPTKGTGRVGTESVVFADEKKAKSFYDAVRRDAVAEILAAGK
ncbi:LCP family protein [Micromonospora sp. NPDC005367]|uniref:LCP family protein n=1 Tax=Micromonospora sp. NPDC005367 TaxID=3155590 RepID=UPI0033BAA2CB